MPQGVYTRIQIRNLRQTLDTILKDAAAATPIVRERVARIAVRIADERNMFEPEELAGLVRAELRETVSRAPA